MIHRIPVNYLSSLWKREGGRDFWEGRFKKRNWYDFYNLLSNKGNPGSFRGSAPPAGAGIQ